MLAEIKALEAQLKQILYNCVEHCQATKAALYLCTSADLTIKTYELVTGYQFNDTNRKVLKATDDLVDRLAVKRNAFFVNGLGADQRLSEILFRQGTDRLLAAPIFSRGRLVGFIDMRDKAGKKPFESPDVDAARRIADDVLSFLGSKNLFGIAPIPIVQLEKQEVRRNDPPASAPAVSMPGPDTGKQLQVMSPEAMRAIASAREVLSKRQLVPSSAGSSMKRQLTDRDLEVVRLLLPATLAIPGAVLACFTAGNSRPQSIVAIATVTDDALQMLQDHLRAFVQRSTSSGAPMKPDVLYPFGIQVAPVSAAGISTILSHPVAAQSVDGLLLTVAFERVPEAQAQRAMQIFLGQIEKSVDAAIAAGGRNDRQIIAEKLLEPDFQRYPDLVEHSRVVSAISHRLASALDLTAEKIETVRLAALVHDVGMRMLDYEKLYNKPSLTAEQLRGVAEHPIIGAALVEPGLGGEIAQAVLRHHERPDGKGYPSKLVAAQIPIASKIIAIADAWVTMTSRNSYRPPITRDEAMQRMRASAGSQFDTEIVEKFLSAVDKIDS